MKCRKLLIVLSLILLAVGGAGCQLMNKLEARDHLNKGVKSYGAKNYDKASEEFKAAIELDPTLIDAFLYLATTYRAEFVPLAQNEDNLRKGREAIATFEKVIELDPNNQLGRAVNAMANIADLYRNMEQPDQAKEWYRKLMALQEDKSQALYGMATIDWKMVDGKTGKDGENVAALTPEEKGKLIAAVDEGINNLKEALKINPDYTDAMEYLNLMYRERAELALNDEEKRQWEREADKLALNALETKRKLQRQAEEARRRVFQGEGGTEQQQQ